MKLACKSFYIPFDKAKRDSERCACLSDVTVYSMVFILASCSAERLEENVQPEVSRSAVAAAGSCKLGQVGASWSKLEQVGASWSKSERK